MRPPPPERRRAGDALLVPRAAPPFGGRSFGRALGDGIVQAVEGMIGESIDARLSRVAIETNEAGVDPFGFDPEAARYGVAVSAFLHRVYFRSEVFGIERLPPGRLLVVANHSGQVPLDGMVLSASLVLDAEPPRFGRGMVDWWVAELPFFSSAFPRIGQVSGSPENARRLLEREEVLLVFPEGTRGISKTFDRRYQLSEFGLGFMRLALETNTPIVPVGIVGAEEQYPALANLRGLGRALGFPSFPIVPQWMLGIPLPLPVRYRLYFGDPLTFTGDPDDDDAVIEEKVWVVKTTIESLLHRGLRERASVFY